MIITPIKKQIIPKDWSNELVLKKLPIPERINSELRKKDCSKRRLPVI